jgi:hypothetical protein
MPGSLSPREISKSFAAVQVLDRVSPVVAAGERIERLAVTRTITL